MRNYDDVMYDDDDDDDDDDDEGTVLAKSSLHSCSRVKMLMHMCLTV